MTYQDKLQTIKDLTGWSTHKLATELGLPVSSVSHVLTGRNADIRSTRNREAVDKLFRKLSE